MRHFVHVHTHSHSSRMELLGSVVIGRGRDVDIGIGGEQSISRQHCALRPMGRIVVIMDLFSKNGVVVEGARLTPGMQYVLEPGQLVALNDAVWFVLESLAEPGDDVTESRSRSR